MHGGGVTYTVHEADVLEALRGMANSRGRKGLMATLRLLSSVPASAAAIGERRGHGASQVRMALERLEACGAAVRGTMVIQGQSRAVWSHAAPAHALSYIAALGNARPQTEQRSCKVCSGPFFARTSPSLNRGQRGTCCSRHCAALVMRTGAEMRMVSAGDVLRLRNDGLCTKEIAARLGCSTTAVRRVLRANGLAYSKVCAGARNGMHGRGHTPDVVARLRAFTIARFASPEERRMASERSIAAIASGKHGRKSSLEIIVGKVLADIGVAAIPQHCIRGAAGGRWIACVDFYLPAYRAALEVNGTFWHADPRVYGGRELKPAQIKTLERYACKEAALRAMDIPILEVWEADIRKDATVAVRNVLAADTARARLAHHEAQSEPANDEAEQLTLDQVGT